MKAKSLEETVRGLLNEQKQPVEPNIEVEEQIGSQLGKRHKPNRSAATSNLGALERRKFGGNQSRTPRSYLKEATAKALKKVDEKKKAKGRTDTGQAADLVELKPTLQSMINNR